MNQIGPKIRELREKAGMTQEQLAARCNLVGLNISRGTLAKMESQVRRITDEEVGLMAKALNVDVSKFYE
ncbi:helix-turn-helix domain-containing protein [Porticoccus sp.]